MLGQAMSGMVGGTDFQVIGDGICEWYDTLLFAFDVRGDKLEGQWILANAGMRGSVVIKLEDIKSINVEMHKIFLV